MFTTNLVIKMSYEENMKDKHMTFTQTDSESQWHKHGHLMALMQAKIDNSFISLHLLQLTKNTN